MDAQLRLAYKNVPLTYHSVLHIIQSNRLEMNLQWQQHQCVKSFIAWMNRNNVCEPFWLKLMYHLIRAFKITVLRSFREGFKTILVEKIEKWTAGAADIVKLLESIRKQMGSQFNYSQFGLMQLAQLMRVSALYMQKQIKQVDMEFVKISETEHKMYKFILSAGDWVRNCKKNMEQVKNQQHKSMKMHSHIAKYYQLREEEHQIQKCLQTRKNNFQISFYKEFSVMYKRFELQFKVLTQINDESQVRGYISSLPYSNDFGFSIGFSPKSYTASEEQQKLYELGKQLSERYKRIPKELRYVCQMLESSDTRFVPCKKKVNQKEMMLDVKDLCQWLSDNLLAKKVWFRIVERLVLVFRLSILCFLTDGFRRIYQNTNKLKLFKRRGEKLMAMIWKIVNQVGPKHWFISFNLIYQSRLNGRLNFDRSIIERIQRQEGTLNLKLTQPQLKVYRLLAKARRWAMKLRKAFNYNISMKGYTSSNIEMEGWIEDLKQIQLEREFIAKEYSLSFNIFECRFYYGCMKFYFYVKEKFEKLVEKIERKQSKKEKRDSQTRQPEFSEDSNNEEDQTEDKPGSKGQNHRKYSRSSSHDESNLNESTFVGITSKNDSSPLKRQWTDRESESDNEQGEMSMDDIYIIPPDEYDILQRKRIKQEALIKKQSAVKQEHMLKLRSSIRQRFESRKYVKVQEIQQDSRREDSVESGQLESVSSEEEGEVGYKKNKTERRAVKQSEDQERSESPVRRKIYDMILLEDD